MGLHPVKANSFRDCRSVLGQKQKHGGKSQRWCRTILHLVCVHYYHRFHTQRGVTSDRITMANNMEGVVNLGPECFARNCTNNQHSPPRETTPLAPLHATGVSTIEPGRLTFTCYLCLASRIQPSDEFIQVVLPPSHSSPPLLEYTVCLPVPARQYIVFCSRLAQIIYRSSTHRSAADHLPTDHVQIICPQIICRSSIPTSWSTSFKEDSDSPDLV